MGWGRRRRGRGPCARFISVRSKRRVAAREMNGGRPQRPLSYRLYVPRPIDLAGPPALLVALHGCTQTAADFAAGTRLDALADRYGLIVLYPEQSPLANP